MQILTDAEFDNQIKNMTDRQLSEFSARQLVTVCRNCKEYDNRITALEKRDQRAFLRAGGAGGFAGTAFGAAIVYLWKFFSKS